MEILYQESNPVHLRMRPSLGRSLTMWMALARPLVHRPCCTRPGIRPTSLSTASYYEDQKLACWKTPVSMAGGTWRSGKWPRPITGGPTVSPSTQPGILQRQGNSMLLGRCGAPS